MFVIAGATGNTGGVVASTLLAQSKPVTVLVRDASKGESWREKGAQVATASLEDTHAVARALAGAEGAYLLIPPDYKTEDALGYGFRVSEALAGAVKTSGIPHVVLLSSVGAQHADGTGPIRSLHHAESLLWPAAKNLTVIRAAYFLQNWSGSVDGVRNQGALHNFLAPERKIPMVSTTDIGKIAAGYLADLAPPDRANALARIGENTLTIAWVQYSLAQRCASYRFALDHLVVAEPENIAAQADLALTLLQQQVAANQLVPMPRFAAVPLGRAMRLASIVK